jgi:CRISPR-associated protein (TIGR03986 family)
MASNPKHTHSGRSTNLSPGARDVGNTTPAAVYAPYNFVPLASWVYIPAWGRQVSHDIPFKDGYSGKISYTLTADSPLLVGGKQTKATKDAPGEVRPFKLPDERYAIPGSSIKGMLRAVTEIVGFGRMRMVDDVRPALRDISGRKVGQSYTDKVRGKVKTGFLRQKADGGQEIVPCQMARLEHRELELVLKRSTPLFKTGLSVADKYDCWKNACGAVERNPGKIAFSIFHQGDESLAKNLYAGDLEGIPVFTGQISDSTQRSGKKRDFVFFSPEEKGRFDVPDNAWRDFLQVHGDANCKREMSWPGYWKDLHHLDNDVPVFYLKDAEILRIGLAYLPKLAGDFSVHKMIEHSSADHLAAPSLGHHDLADLLFGAVNGEDQAGALRGRVSCETLVQETGPIESTTHGPTILSSPKPTYFPCYVTQETTSKTDRLGGDQYATYMCTPQQQRPTLRGFKRYPARDTAGAQALTSDQQKNKEIQVRLVTLNPGARFCGRVVFHNLTRIELGALIWVMTWGNNPDRRHALGMGKPFGFGQAHLSLDLAHSHIQPNDSEQPASDLGELAGAAMREFAQHMETESVRHGGWSSSPQLENLIAMADSGAAQNIQLRYMQLDGRRRNDFQEAKRDGVVLPDYATASGRRTRNLGSSSGSTRITAPAAASRHEQWLASRLKFNNKNETLTATGPNNAEAHALKPRGRELLDSLPPETRRDIEAGRHVKVQATVSAKSLIAIKPMSGR